MVLIMLPEDYAKAIKKRIQTARIGNFYFPIASPEDLVILKGLTKREKDIAPIWFLAQTLVLNRRYIEKWTRRFGVWRFVNQDLR